MATPPSKTRNSLMEQLKLLNSSQTDINSIADENPIIEFQEDQKLFNLNELGDESRKPSLTAQSHIMGISAMPSPPITLNPKQKLDVTLAFEAFDLYGTGYIPTSNIALAFQAMGFHSPKKSEIRRFLETFDRNNTGQISYPDFLHIIEIKTQEADSQEDIMQVFHLFDKDQTGRISFENLRQVADELGENVSDDELHEMLWDAGVSIADSDGTLDQEDFYNILKKFTLY